MEEMNVEIMVVLKCTSIALKKILRGVWIVFRPYPDKFIQVMSTKNRRIPSQVVEVIHNDGNEQIQHLKVQ